MFYLNGFLVHRAWELPINDDGLNRVGGELVVRGWFPACTVMPDINVIKISLALSALHCFLLSIFFLMLFFFSEKFQFIFNFFLWWFHQYFVILLSYLRSNRNQFPTQITSLSPWKCILKNLMRDFGKKSRALTWVTHFLWLKERSASAKKRENFFYHVSDWLG